MARGVVARRPSRMAESSGVAWSEQRRAGMCVGRECVSVGRVARGRVPLRAAARIGGESNCYLRPRPPYGPGGGAPVLAKHGGAASARTNGQGGRTEEGRGGGDEREDDGELCEHGDRHTWKRRGRAGREAAW